MNFFTLQDQQRLRRYDPMRQNTMDSARPMFMGGNSAPLSLPGESPYALTRPAMEMPLTGLYPKADVPVPVSVNDLAGSGGYDYFPSSSLESQGPSGRIPMAAGVNLLDEGPAPTALPQAAPEKPYSLLDDPNSTPTDKRLEAGTQQTPESASPWEQRLMRFAQGAAEDQRGQKATMPEAPRLNLQTPTPGVGGRAVDLTAYLRKPITRRG